MIILDCIAFFGVEWDEMRQLMEEDLHIELPALLF